MGAGAGAEEGEEEAGREDENEPGGLADDGVIDDEDEGPSARSWGEGQGERLSGVCGRECAAEDRCGEGIMPRVAIVLVEREREGGAEGRAGRARSVSGCIG